MASHFVSLQICLTVFGQCNKHVSTLSHEASQRRPTWSTPEIQCNQCGFQPAHLQSPREHGLAESLTAVCQSNQAVTRAAPSWFQPATCVMDSDISIRHRTIKWLSCQDLGRHDVKPGNQTVAPRVMLFPLDTQKECVSTFLADIRRFAVQYRADHKSHLSLTTASRTRVCAFRCIYPASEH